MTYRFLIACCLFSGYFGALSAQTDTLLYKGLRISLFNFHLLEQNKKSVRVSCQVANTGRLPVAISRRNTQDLAALVVELDTAGLPSVLQGREYLMKKALQGSFLHLEPGQLWPHEVRLSIPVRGQQAFYAPPSVSVTGACADLVIDTAYVAEYTDKIMRLGFTIRNQGNQPANLEGKSARTSQDNVALNVYFARGTRLSPGAIFVDAMFFRTGHETLDGQLQPGQTVKGALEISLKNRTRFSPNLVLELDPFQRVEECDRTNNTRAVVVEF